MPAADNSFVIGAIVDSDQYAEVDRPGHDINQESLSNVVVQWLSASTETAKAVKKISDATLQGALSVSEGSKQAAAASLAHAAALREVGAASILVKKAGEDNANELAILASAQERAALAALRFKEAQEAAGIASTKVAGAMGMARVEAGALDGSTGMVVGGFARLAAQSETLGPLIQAAFVPFAIGAFADLIFQAGEKLYKLYQNVILNKDELDALDKVEKNVTETTAKLAEETENEYQALLKLEDPLEGAREKIRAISQESFKFKIDDKELEKLNGLDASFGKFVKELSDFPASQLSQNIQRVTGSIEYLQQKLNAPVLRGILSRDELQGQLALYQNILKAMEEMQSKVDVQQRVGVGDLGKEKEEQQKKAEEAAKKNWKMRRTAHLNEPFATVIASIQRSLDEEAAGRRQDL